MITIGIPTYNRKHIWEKEYLIKSLLPQFQDGDELIIVDDDSSDDTCHWLSAHLPLNGIDTKIFKINPYEKQKYQASGLADNILFRETKGEVFIHLDDDGWVSPNLLEQIRSIEIEKNPSMWYGEIRSCNLEKKSGTRGDVRLKYLDQLNAALKKTDQPESTILPLMPEWGMSWGALWIAPTKELRLCGGHDVENMHRRGQDSRLGFRLSGRLPQFFSTDFYFNHIGNSLLQEIASKGITNGTVKQAEEIVYLPDKPESPFMNGGESFWMSDYWNNIYERIA